MSQHPAAQKHLSENSTDTGAMRFAFWSWTTIIVVGLAIMIALPLTGR